MESRIDPYIYYQLIFDQVSSIRKENSLQRIVLEKLDICMEKIKAQPLPYLLPKNINSKLIIDLNLKANKKKT